MPKIRRRRQRKDYRVADAAKKNPENETEEIVVTEDVEEMDDLDDDDMDNAEPPANATNDTASDSLTEDKIEAGIDSEEDLLDGIPEEELKATVEAAALPKVTPRTKARARNRAKRNADAGVTMLTGDPVRMYLKEIGKVPLLTAADFLQIHPHWIVGAKGVGHGVGVYDLLLGQILDGLNGWLDVIGQVGDVVLAHSVNTQVFQRVVDLVHLLGAQVHILQHIHQLGGGKIAFFLAPLDQLAQLFRAGYAAHDLHDLDLARLHAGLDVGLGNGSFLILHR